MNIREELAACCRLMARYGMTDLNFTPVSGRDPDGTEFYINPTEHLYDKVTASSMVPIPLRGDIDVPVPDNANYGWFVHRAIYTARPDVNCIIHTHSRAGTAVACLRGGLKSISQHSFLFHNRIGYYDYHGIADTDFAATVLLVDALRVHRAMILRNHGLLVAGRSVAEAFELIYNLEAACKIQVDIESNGDDMPISVSEEKAEEFARQWWKHGREFGRTSWPALVRGLDSSFLA